MTVAQAGSCRRNPQGDPDPLRASDGISLRRNLANFAFDLNGGSSCKLTVNGKPISKGPGNPPLYRRRLP